MNTRIKFFLHEWHYLIVLGIVVTTIGLSFLWFQKADDWKALLPIVGGAVPLIYIFQKQQLDEAILFKDLFRDFNSRYGALNDELNKIKSLPTEQWSDAQRANVDEYFNLCCEEYLYFRKGFIMKRCGTAG